MSRRRLAGRPLRPVNRCARRRLEKFKREQQIVNYLNRGVSVPEIAVRVGLSEKRMRAVIREIIVRRAPAPPEEFLAIQVSRLNEALLVAFGAMTGANLKAVDRVVRIVRELDRYHGAFAAVGLQRPDPARLAAPAAATAAYGAALICQAQFGPAHDEEIEGAPGIAPGRKDACPDPVLIQGLSPATSEAPPAASAGDNRSENPAQDLEKVESAPGIASSETSRLAAHASGLQNAPPLVVPQHQGGEAPPAASPGDERPAKLLQDFEKVESGPGHGRLAETASASEGATVGPAVLNSGFLFCRVRMTPNGAMAW